MAPRVAEHVVRGRLFGPSRLLRVDLHGVSEFGAGDERALIRWEWVETIEVERGAVLVKGADECITMPSGAFGMDTAELASELERARAIHNRSDVIARLTTDAGDDEDDDG
ncbi:MAG TPA: hypothetical protein VFK43_20130 [Acidimicrobiales bacterium]|nr:hypothetical protein [Acidimicrobiales bacterium]